MFREVDERGGERIHRERALKNLRELAGRMTDPVRGELFLDEVASLFGVSRQALAEGFVSPKRAPEPEVAPPVVGEAAAGSLEERRLIRLALGSAEARRVLLDRMAADRFSTAQLRELVARLADLGEGTGVIERVDQLGIEGTDLEPVMARLLATEAGEPAVDEDFDFVAEIDALLAQLEQRTQRDERTKNVAATNDAYYSGGDWKAEMERRLKDSRD
jgi:hypothetical protein